MKRAWKPIAFAFLLGGCIGVVSAPWVSPRLFHRYREKGLFQQRLLDRFSSKLKLSPEQRSKVSAILEAKRQKMDALRSQVRPQFEDIRTATSLEIRQLLEPEQQQAFDLLEDEWRRRAKRFRERGTANDGKP